MSLFTDNVALWIGALLTLVGILSTWRLLWAHRRADLLNERKEAYAAFYSAVLDRERRWAPLPFGLFRNIGPETMERSIELADSDGIRAAFDSSLARVETFGSDEVVQAALRVAECFTNFEWEATTARKIPPGNEDSSKASLLSSLQEAMSDYELAFRKELGAGRKSIRGAR